jgi:hypothetical protein
VTPIPHTHYRSNGDGTAWWLFAPPWTLPELQVYNRPCDTCGGRATVLAIWANPQGKCRFCDGTGRHTITVEVERACPADTDGDGDCALCSRTPLIHGTVTRHVHVLDVLPVQAFADCRDEPGDHVCLDATTAVLITENGDCPEFTPPAATEPGMWLIRVQEHQ